MKYHKYGYVSQDALRHMIGQVQDCFGRGVTICEIAAWFGVSKPTAQRFVVETNHGIEVSMKDWRKGHSVIYVYNLNDIAFSAYQRGVYKASYKTIVGMKCGDL